MVRQSELFSVKAAVACCFVLGCVLQGSRSSPVLIVNILAHLPLFVAYGADALDKPSPAAATASTLLHADPPPWQEKALTARWMVANTDWGVLSTSSVHLNGTAFGNPNSFVDGGNGSLYFYVTDRDASMQVALA
eukprot:6212934-Pleurochrysis_carterae.AAC.2